MVLLKEVQAFTSASEHLVSVMDDTLLSMDERSLIHYYIRELEQKLELTAKDSDPTGIVWIK